MAQFYHQNRTRRITKKILSFSIAPLPGSLAFDGSLLPHEIGNKRPANNSEFDLGFQSHHKVLQI